MVRHFLRDDDLSAAEQLAVLDLADRLKADRFACQTLAGPRSVAVLFDKPSTRTRVAVSTAIAQLGGYPLILDTATTQLGRGEPIADTARVLDRQCAAIIWRTFAQDHLEQLAAASSVPVINALTDLVHPCQVLADLQTVRERKGALAGLTAAFIGDGSSNMAHSWLLGGATAGMQVRVATDPHYQPDAAVLADATARAQQTGGSVQVLLNPREAATGADVIITDTWVSMGHETRQQQREQDLRPYTVDAALVGLGRHPVVLHCLPAYRGREITAEVLDAPDGAIWDEAENRLHTHKAILVWLLER